MDILKNKLQFDFDTNQIILNAVSKIDSFKSTWQVLENKENMYLKELKYIATIESSGSSTRIEGSALTDSEIKELIKNIQITKLVSRDQQEVMGYYETLDFIYDNYLEIQLTQNHIYQLHQKFIKI